MPLLNLTRRFAKLTHRPLKSQVSHRLLKGIIVLWAFILTLEVAAIGYGHLHPDADDDSVRGLALCGDVPCFRNMIPGRTAWTVVRATFSQSGINHIYDRKVIVPLGLDGSATLYASGNEMMLGLISVHVSSSAPISLGEIIEQYGQPCGIGIATDAGVKLQTLDYPLLTISIHVLDGHLNPDSRITDFVLLDPAMTAAQHFDPCKGVYTGTVPQSLNEPWHGFASTWRYLNEK